MIAARTKKVAILALTYCVLTGTVFVVALRFVDKAGHALEEQARVVRESEVRQQQYADLQTIAEASATDRERLMSLVIAEDDAIYFLNEIETLARQQGVQLETDSLNVTQPGNTAFKVLTLNVSLAGSRERVLYFIRTLESMPYHGHVSSIKMSLDKNTNQYQANVVLEASLKTP